MKFNGIRCTLACVGIAVLLAPVALAQQQSAASDPYQGVSQPPPDDTIVTMPDTPAPVAAVKPKPSPQVYAPPPPPAAVQPTPASDQPVVTTGPSSANSRWDNTDYGIVTKPVPYGDDDPQLPYDTTVLHVRDTPARRYSGPANELAEGTQIRVRLDQELSTSDTQVGAPFQGKVAFNVIQNGSIIIPAGSTLRGRVVQVSQGHHFGPAATLRLRPETVILPDGTAYHLDAQVTGSGASGTRTGSEGAIQPSAHILKKTAEYGVGVGTGAMVGAELAGPPGALFGSIAGAGVITTHLLLQHPKAATVPAGSEITFSLTQPLDLVPTRN